jgi:hypothetical protein
MKIRKHIHFYILNKISENNPLQSLKLYQQLLPRRKNKFSREDLQWNNSAPE